MRCGQALSLLLSLGLGPTLGAQAEGKKEVHLRTRVVDASGQGIAGVGVIWGPAGSLRTADALRNPIAVSDAEGVISFRAAGPPPDIGYMATPLCGLFAKRGYSTIRVSTNSAIMGIPWGAGPAHYLSGITDKVVMRPAGTLSGMVRGADGRPLRGGRVVAMEPLMAGGLKRFFANGAGRQVCYSAATSNASGRFELPGVHPGGMSLEVTAPGYYRKGLRFVAKDQPVDVTLEPSGFVSGKVLDSEGRPVLATISLRSEGHAAQIGIVSRQLRTEPDGSFRISLAARGRYSLQAIQAAPFHSSRMVSSEILSGPRSDIVLEMEVLPEPPAPIKVTVVESGSKKPLAKARVAVWWQEPRYYSLVALKRAFATGAKPVKDGQAELPGPGEHAPPKGSLLVKAEGFAPRVVRGIEYDPDEPPAIEVQMSRGGFVEGTVVDEAGEALADAAVHAGPRSNQVGSPWNTWGASVSGPGSKTHRLRSRTDAKGKFRIENLPDGHHELYARVPGRPRSEQIHVKVSPGKLRHQARLTVPKGETLAGRVYLRRATDKARQGAGLGDKGFRVQLVPGRGASSMRMFSSVGPFNPGGWLDQEAIPSSPVSYTSDLADDGGFQFTGVAAGRYRFCLVAPPLGEAGQPFSIAIEPLRVRNKPIQRDFNVSEDLGGIVRGKITMPGVRVPMGRICVLSKPASYLNPSARLHFNASWMRCIAGQDGSFAFHASKGDHQIWLIDALDGTVLHRHPELVRLKTNETAQLDLEVPLALLRIRLRAEDPAAGFVASNLEWQFTHPGVPPDQNFFIYNRYQGMAVEGREEFLLRVPIVSVDVAVHSSIAMVDPTGGHQRHAIGEGNIVPVLGRLNTLEIRVSPPPEASGSTRK